MREIVAIWYRGATYQLGRGRNFYGIWPAAVPRSQPFERWPLTPEGWYGAWSRFAAIEAPGTIVPVVQATGAADQSAGAADQSAGPVTQSAGPVTQSAGPVTQSAGPGGQSPAPVAGTDSRPAATAGTDPYPAPVAGTHLRSAPVPGTDSRTAAAAGTDLRTAAAAGTDVRPAPVAGLDPRTEVAAGLDLHTEPAGGTDVHPAAGAGADWIPGLVAEPDARLAAAAGPDAPTAAAAGPDWRPGSVAGPGPVPATSRNPRAVIAAALLAVGVGLGIAGLFPGYLGGASLAQQPAQLVPHVIYLAVWAGSALLILLGGARLRTGALVGTGMSIVTFGFFLADLGTVIAGGSNLMGTGLVLGLFGWLACAAGSVTAFRLRPAGQLPPAGRPVRPRGRAIESVLMLTLAALGAAVAFAPAWDSYTLRTPAGVVQTLTAGDAFSNPGWVIAGDVAVMVALVAVAVAAAAWRPVLRGTALLAGATIPMAAQAISALIQVGQATSPAQFGIPPAQAAQAGLTISSGVTPAFWIYCAFVVALGALCAWMVARPRSVERNAATPQRSVGLDVIPPATSTFS